MRVHPLIHAAALTLALGGMACAGNKSSDEIGGARDSTISAKVDSTTNQTESGITDSTGQSTLGKGVEQTRPDQGQPVTAKGDTLNPGVDSASTREDGQGGAAQDSNASTTHSDSTSVSDSTHGIADSTANQTESGVTDSSGTSTLGKGVEQTRPDQGQPVTSKGDTVNPGIDSSSTGR